MDTSIIIKEELDAQRAGLVAKIHQEIEKLRGALRDNAQK